MELDSFRVLHGTTDRDCLLFVLVLTNTRRPWHGVPGCVCCDNYPGPDRRLHASQLFAVVLEQHDRTTIDCVQSWSSDCAVVRSAFSETAREYQRPLLECIGRFTATSLKLLSKQRHFRRSTRPPNKCSLTTIRNHRRFFLLRSLNRHFITIFC